MTDRAVSTVLGYILGLAVITAMMTGLFVTTSGIVEDQQEQAIRSELRVLGNQLAADVTAVDRLVLAGTATDVRITRSLPTAVAGSSYRIELSSDGSRPATIELETSNPDVAVTVQVMNGTAIGNSTASGGDLVVEFESGEVVIDDA